MTTQTSPHVGQQVILFTVGWATLEKYFLKPLTNAVALGQALSTNQPLFAVSTLAELYTVVYKMCSQRAPHCYASDIYDSLSSYLSNYFSTVVRDTAAVEQGTARLARLVLAWKNCQQMTKYIQNVFGYLDRWIKPRESSATSSSTPSPTRLPIASLIATLFQSQVLDPLSDSAVRAALDLIRLSREMMPSDLSLVYETVAMLLEVDPRGVLFRERFQGPLLRDTREFYSSRARELLQKHSGDCSAYAREVEGILQRERDRAFAILPSTHIRGTPASTSSGISSIAMTITSTSSTSSSTSSAASAGLPASSVAPSEASRGVLSATHCALLLQPQREVLGVTPEDKISSPVISGSFQDLLLNFSAPGNLGNIERVYRLYSSVPTSLPLLAHAFSLHVIRQATAALQSVQDLPLPAPPAGAKSTALPPPHVVLHMRLSHVVPRLAQVHDAAQGLLIACFRDDKLFAKQMRAALEQVVGLRLGAVFAPARLLAPHPAPAASAMPPIPTMAELLANQADAVLRMPGGTGAGGGASATLPTPAQIEANLATLAKLFELLPDKDAFQEAYRKLLAKRLLLSRSLSLTFEEAMVARMREICGPQFTSRLEVMLLDASHTSQISEAYATSPAFYRNGVDVSVRTLTLGSWPHYPTDNTRLAAPLQAHVEAFERFYHASTASRKLQWVHSLGTAVLRAKWLPGSPEILCSALQASVLLQFSSSNKERSAGDLLSALNMDKTAFQLQARPLYTGAAPLLVKSPPEGFAPMDIFRLNMDVKIPPNVKRLKIAAPLAKLPPPQTAQAQAQGQALGQLSQSSSQGSAAGRPGVTRATTAGTAMSDTVTPTEAQGATQALGLGLGLDSFESGKLLLSEADKSHCVDAHIVRIMKKSKKISHSELVSKVIDEVKNTFPVDQSLVKHRIEELILREYLERDPSDASMYLYA